MISLENFDNNTTIYYIVHVHDSLGSIRISEITLFAWAPISWLNIAPEIMNYGFASSLVEIVKLKSLKQIIKAIFRTLNQGPYFTLSIASCPTCHKQSHHGRSVKTKCFINFHAAVLILRSPTSCALYRCAEQHCLLPNHFPQLTRTCYLYLSIRIQLCKILYKITVRNRLLYAL